MWSRIVLSFCSSDTASSSVIQWWICISSTRTIEIIPANIRLYEDVFGLCLQKTFLKTSSRRPDQDEYVSLNLTSSEDVLKTSWWRPIYSSWPYVFKTSSWRFQDVFKTSWQDVLKTFSRRIARLSSRHLQDVFKTFWKRLQDIFKTFSRRNIKLKCCR